MTAGRSRRRGVAVAVAAAVLAVVFAAGRVLTGGIDPDPPDCADPVAWTDAAAHEGDRAAVVGPVAGATHAPDVGGEPTFLNLGNPHPDPERFDVVIYRELRDAFDPPPEVRFADHDVCVVGRVRVRDGVPQIILDRPADIEIAAVHRSASSSAHARLTAGS